MSFLFAANTVVIVFAVVAVLGIGVCLWFIATYNKLKQLQVKIKEADSGIDVALTKRYDLLTKAFNVAKNYAKHEKETLYEVISVRKGMSIPEKSAVDSKLGNMNAMINALQESYPTLKADALFSELSKSINDSEEHLQAARRLYNSNVSIYNQMIVSFPINVFFKMNKSDFFKAEDKRREDVDMSMD